MPWLGKRDAFRGAYMAWAQHGRDPFWDAFVAGRTHGIYGGH